MTSKVSTVSSLVYGSPRHFFNAMSTARLAAGVPVRTVRRTARGRKPSSAAEPSGSPRPTLNRQRGHTLQRRLHTRQRWRPWR